MKAKFPPKSPDRYKSYIRRLSYEFTRRLNLEYERETSQKMAMRSPRIVANEFLKRNAYSIGLHIEQRGFRDELVLHVSQMARRHRHERSGFANKNDNIFVWVLRLVVVHQGRKGWVEINRKTMSKYAHQLDYAALHNIHPNWLIEFLKAAGTDQEVSDRLKGRIRLDIDKRWTCERTGRE